MYELLARQHGIQWRSREYDHTQWGSGDLPNRCLSSATACLYGICEAAILAAGYAPAIGFIHTGKPVLCVRYRDLFKLRSWFRSPFGSPPKRSRNRNGLFGLHVETPSGDATAEKDHSDDRRGSGSRGLVSAEGASGIGATSNPQQGRDR